MTSIVGIVNSALVSLGANTISDLEDSESVEARNALAKWDIIRRSELRKHPWNFCVRRRNLNATVATPEYRFKYIYTLHSDTLRLLSVYENVDFKLEGKTILTNADTCYVKYIYDCTDTDLWDASFVDVISSRLAAELAYSIPGKENMVALLTNIYNEKLELARAIDASEDIEDQMGQEMSSLISTRYNF